jgi:phospholipase/carboxylesterase
MPHGIARHIFVLLAAGMAGCRSDSPVNVRPNGREHLQATPIATTITGSPGTYALSVAATKDAVLIIPASVSTTAPVPLVVMLHGAGGGQPPLDQVIATAEQQGVAVLIPRSRQSTWDMVAGEIGEDVEIIDRALEATFARVKVDPNHIALAGFSDGASYALTLGIANGNLFSHVMAFAPGFLSPVDRSGRPAILIVHGNQDGILNQDNTIDNIIPFLRALGYSVEFHPFDGGHQVLAPESEFAFHWFLGNH